MMLFLFGMNVTLKSKVNKDLDLVHSGFNADLFKYLLPPGAELIQFGGSLKGDIVHLKLPVVGEWISEITKDGKTSDSYYFIDEGRTLPFPIKRWRHRHTLQRDGENTLIIDDMSFSTGYLLLDVLVYPGILLGFYPRKWQYGRYFKSKR